jgi:hypothetical protein
MEINDIGLGYRGNPHLKKTGVPIEWTPALLEEYIKCKNDPIYFIETYVKIIHVDRGLIPFIMYDYQKELIKKIHNNRKIVANWARQSGKSQTICAYLLWFILFNDEKTVAILANKGDTAREILGKVRTSYQNLPAWLTHGIVEWNKGSILLENDSRIIACATSSDNVRGYTIAIAYIDEAAFVENFSEFFQSVYPTISSGQETKILMTSTPHGLNHFYQLVAFAKKKKTEPKEWNGYEVSEVIWSDVPGRDEKWRQETLASLNFDQDKFNQEFCAEFLGSSGTLISGKKLKELVHKTVLLEKEGLKQYFKPIPDRKYALVADVARGKGIDYSAFSVIDITEMPYQQVAVFKDNLILPVDYGEVIHNVAKIYNDALVLVETNDIGEQICDILYYDYEYINIVQTENNGAQGKRISQGFGGRATDRGIRTTVRVKNIGCSILKMLIEQNQLSINDAETISELSTFSKKNKTYEAEPGKHDDIVMGLVLFAWMTDQVFFKEYADINTLYKLRERSDEEIFNDLVPFGLYDDGLGDDAINFEGQMVSPEQNDDGPSFF